MMGLGDLCKMRHNVHIFPMRCKCLVMLMIASFIVASTSMAIKNCDERYRPGNLKASKINPKSGNIASKGAKDAQPQPQPCARKNAGNRGKTLPTDKAVDESKAAKTVLAGKKQLVESLESSLSEIKKVLEEMKKAAASSSCVAKLVKRIQNTDKKNVAKLKSLYGKIQVSLEKIRSVAENAKREAEEKRKLQQTAKWRVQNLKKVMEEMQADLKCTRVSAKKANCAAKQAQQRVDTIQHLTGRLRNLKKKDLQSLSKFLHRRKRGS